MLKCCCFVLLLIGLSACAALNPSEVAPTAIVLVRPLATVYSSPSPNPQELAATLALVSPTFSPLTPTIRPTETPYIGIFLGEAPRPLGLEHFQAPLFANVNVGEPTADATRCNIPIDSPYVKIWQTDLEIRQRLGCPIQGGFGFFGQVQFFEGGLMYFYPDLNAIWAMPTTSGRSARYDYLENPVDSPTVGLSAPAGLTVPSGIFGNMWLTVPNLRERLGFARTNPQEISMNLQRFQNGIFLYDVSGEQIYALVTDNTLLGPYLPEPNLQAEATP